MEPHGSAVQHHPARSGISAPRPKPEPFDDCSSSRRDRQRVQVRVLHAPSPWIRHPHAGQLNGPFCGYSFCHPALFNKAIKFQYELHRPGEVRIHEGHIDVNEAQLLCPWKHVGPPNPHLALVREVVEEYTPHEPTIMPKVATSMQRCGRPVEAVVRQHEQFPAGCSPCRGRQVEPPGHVTAGAVISDLPPIDKNSAVERACHELQSCPALLVEAGAVHRHTADPEHAGQGNIHGGRHRSHVGCQLRSPRVEICVHGVKARVQVHAILPLAIQTFDPPLTTIAWPERRLRCKNTQKGQC
mmetsp:Transcript_125924/g.350843  ORF Transcript_125924/g.350843 Transcript_125924/m.350843 type:complete len:299 (+) Transcript_125924:996-1892(+)